MAIGVGPFTEPQCLLGDALVVMAGSAVACVALTRWALAPVREVLAQWRDRDPPIHVDHVYLDQRTFVIERDERD